MKINKNHLVTIAIIAICALCTSAANRVYIKDFAIKPGETKFVELYLESTKEVRSFQADITLPEGLMMDCDNVVLSVRSNQHIVYADSSGINTYTVIAFSLSNTAFNGKDGTIVEIPITASNDFSCSAQVEMSEIIVEATDKTILINGGASSCKAFIAYPMAETTDDTTEPIDPEQN